jgi:hypothetical protein
MGTLDLGLAAVSVGVLAACGPQVGVPVQATEGSGSGSTDESADEESGVPPASRQPFRDEWRVEADLPFVHVDPTTGMPLVFELAIGGRETADNFANRGDVIVNFDGPADRILVELRRFTFTVSQEDAEQDYGNLHLWAFAAAPGRPQDQDVTDDCIASGWQNGCNVRVYYDDLVQPQRSGADIRVTLPPDYRQSITVVTEDDVEEADYQNRGNVCIAGLHATAEVEVQSGNVWVSLADDATPVPTCTLAQIDACEQWTVEDGMGNQIPAPWAPECDCIAVGGGVFGRLAIANEDGAASNVTVDMPAGLWASIRAENQGLAQDVAGEHCEASVTVPGFVPNRTGNDFPWEAFGNASYPGEPAIMGAGYSIQATSSACGPVVYTEHPEDFVGPGNEAMQATGERGNLEVCTGCIAQACDELVP